MSDALLVRRIQSLANLACVLQRLIERQRAFKRRAVDVLHHQVIRPDIVELANMGMIQRGDRTRFPLEALRKLLLGNLDRDGAIKPRIAGLVYLAHAARANRREDLVGPELCPAIQGHYCAPSSAPRFIFPRYFALCGYPCQSPERSGWPSGLRGADAARSGLPSGRRSIPGVG